MGKRRALDTSIRKSETFASFSFRQRDLWHGLIAIADDQGRMPANPIYIRSQVWPYDDLPLHDVEEDLSVIENAGNIRRYSINGRAYLQIVNWWKYQAGEWFGISEYPAPPGWVDRARYHSRGNEIKLLNWDKVGGYSNVLPSLLPSVLPRRDVNDEVNGDDNDEVNGDGEVADTTTTPDEIPIISQLSVAFCNATNIPELTGGPKKWMDALEKLEKAGVTPDDVISAVGVLREKDYSIVGISSIVNTAISEMSKRTKGKHDASRRDSAEDRKRYLEWATPVEKARIK